MFEKKTLREWSSNDKLPKGFANWMKDYIRENEVIHKKGFRQIASQLGVDPSILSRWIAGMGPLTQHDIQILAANLSPVVYSFLGVSRPDHQDLQNMNILKNDQIVNMP